MSDNDDNLLLSESDADVDSNSKEEKTDKTMTPATTVTPSVAPAPATSDKRPHKPRTKPQVETISYVTVYGNQRIRKENVSKKRKTARAADAAAAAAASLNGHEDSSVQVIKRKRLKIAKTSDMQKINIDAASIARHQRQCYERIITLIQIHDRTDRMQTLINATNFVQKNHNDIYHAFWESCHLRYGFHVDQTLLYILKLEHDNIENSTLYKQLGLSDPLIKVIQKEIQKHNEEFELTKANHVKIQDYMRFLEVNDVTLYLRIQHGDAPIDRYCVKVDRACKSKILFREMPLPDPIPKWFAIRSPVIKTDVRGRSSTSHLHQGFHYFQSDWNIRSGLYENITNGFIDLAIAHREHHDLTNFIVNQDHNDWIQSQLQANLEHFKCATKIKSSPQQPRRHLRAKQTLWTLNIDLLRFIVDFFQPSLPTNREIICPHEKPVGKRLKTSRRR
jgi:hypothetical protein